MVGASSKHQKIARFPVRAILRFQVRSVAGVRMGGSGSMFLFHINVSLPTTQLPLSLKSINISSVKIKKKNKKKFNYKNINLT